MNLQLQESGSYIAEEDPGELGVPGQKRRVSITDAEGKLLGFLVAGKRVLEIGTGLGVSTNHLACHAAKVVTVDVDPWVHANVFPTLHKRVECVTKRDDVEGIFDVCFIDARHTTSDTRLDIAYAQQKVHRGLILVHDARIPEVRAAFPDDMHIISTTHGLGVWFVGW